MTEADLPALHARLIQLADALRHKHPTTEGMKVWIDVLREFTFPQIEHGLHDCAKRSNRIATPADVWRSCNDARTTHHKKSVSEDRTTEATIHSGKHNAMHSQELNATLERLKQASRDDPKDWARIIHFRFVTGLNWRNGQQISSIQINSACVALRESVVNAYAARNESKKAQLVAAVAFTDPARMHSQEV